MRRGDLCIPGILCFLKKHVMCVCIRDRYTYTRLNRAIKLLGIEARLH